MNKVLQALGPDAKVISTSQCGEVLRLETSLSVALIPSRIPSSCALYVVVPISVVCLVVEWGISVKA